MKHALSGPAALLSVWIALTGGSVCASETPVRQEWIVDGITREALVHIPEDTGTHRAPLIFVFHGHGGSMQNTMRRLHIHSLWPEAIVVYPQGLKTPGRLTDPEGARPGWQHGSGDQEDRDLKFFDAMLNWLSEAYNVDEQHVYSTGHSNGGRFTYLLWATRGDRLTAVAPSASALSRQYGRQLKPKPVLHLAGEKDVLVKFEWQERTIKVLRRLNECGAGEPWGEENGCTRYESRVEAPVVTFIHPGGHNFPSEAPGLIVKFFKNAEKPGLNTTSSP